MWTHENRAKYNRDYLRYPSDLTDDEWRHVKPFIAPAKSGGGKRRTDMRAVMNGVMTRAGSLSVWTTVSHKIDSIGRVVRHGGAAWSYVWSYNAAVVCAFGKG